MAAAVVDRIIAFEQGELDTEGVLTLFGELIADGTAWSLQGSYGRAAAALIEDGVLLTDGQPGPNYDAVLEG